MIGLSRLIAFDRENGTLKAEAGATFGEIMRRIVPYGYFLPVTPGTRYVTLGGAVANDVHGKNHHQVGTFGRHISSLRLLRHDGGVTLSPAGNDNGLFEATIGGLGLTGLVEWVEIKLQPIKSSSLDVDIIPYSDLSEYWNIAETYCTTHEFAAAWIDCTAKCHPHWRGLFSRANWAAEGQLIAHRDQRRISVPPIEWGGLLNRLTVRIFNELYYNGQRRKKDLRQQQHYSQFLHALDSVANWNRLYGAKGFWQYHCAVPRRVMKDAITALLNEIRSFGTAPFLAVLKTCGPLPSPGLLSFPMEGATLALDFPNCDAVISKLFPRLDAIVCEAGGRLYAAKDGRVPKEVWAAGYPQLESFLSHVDPHFASDFWRRVAPRVV